MRFQTGRESTSRIRNVLAILLSGGVIIAFAIIIVRNWGRYAELFDISGASISLLASLTLVPMIGNGLINYSLYRELGAKVSMGESLALSAMNSFVNLLPISVGVVAKALYLKKQHKLPYERFLAATIALYVVFLFASGLTGIAMLLYLDWMMDGSSPPILYVAFLAMSASILTFVLPSRTQPGSGSIRHRISEALTGWGLLKRRPRLVLWLVLIQVIMSLMLAWRLRIAFRSLSQEVTLAHCLLYSAATILTQLVTIMPGGLGIREGIVTGLSSLQGFDAAASAMAVGLDRIVSSIVILALGALSTAYVGKRMGNSRPAETRTEDLTSAAREQEIDEGHEKPAGSETVQPH